MKISTVVSLQILSLCIVASNCQDPVIPFSAGSIFFFPNQNKTHNEAFAACKSRRLKLLEIVTKDISDAINAQVPKWLDNVGYWIGGYFVNKTWMWVSGESMKYVDWSNHQPVWSIPTKCASIGVDRRKEWSKVPCRENLGYVCQSDPLRPAISKIEVDDCTGNFTIHWVPAITGTSFRIVVRPMNKVDGKSINETVEVHTNDLHKFEGRDLTPLTLYNVTITPCPSFCRDEQSTSDTFTTGKGLKLPVKTIYAQFNTENGKTCSGQILSSKSQRSIIDTFTVVISRRPRLQSQLWSDEPDPVVTTKIIHPSSDDSPNLFWFRMEPNTKYSIHVRSQNCAGIGPSFVALGNCEMKSSVPDDVPSPSVVHDNGNTKVRIYPIDEKNGPASCYFLLLTASSTSNIQKQNQSLVEKDLLYQARLASQVLTASQENVTYLAAAIPSTDIPEAYVEVTLGNNSTSTCDEAWITTSPDSSDIMINGKNFPLLMSTPYRLRAIVSIPGTETSIQYKSSPEVEFLVGGELQDSTDTYTDTSPAVLIISITVGLIFAILIIIALLVVIKRRKIKRTREEAPTTTPIRNSIDSFHSAPSIPAVTVTNQLPSQGHPGIVPGYVKMAALPPTYQNINSGQRDSGGLYEIPIQRQRVSGGDHFDRHLYDVPDDGNDESHYQDVEYFTIDS